MIHHTVTGKKVEERLDSWQRIGHNRWQFKGYTIRKSTFNKPIGYILMHDDNTIVTTRSARAAKMVGLILDMDI